MEKAKVFVRNRAIKGVDKQARWIHVDARSIVSPMMVGTRVGKSTFNTTNASQLYLVAHLGCTTT